MGVLSQSKSFVHPTIPKDNKSDPDDGVQGPSKKKVRKPTKQNKKNKHEKKSMRTKTNPKSNRDSRAKAKEAIEEGRAKPSRNLKFPGIKKTGHPVFYGESTVYIDTDKCWRLKPSPGVRVCTHFYFKGRNPKEIWKRVVLELRRLNP